MWAEKRYNQPQNWQNGSSNNYKINIQNTPRTNINKPNVPLPNSRRSITPSRMNQRVNASPLRVPLQKAIEKCTREKSQQRPNSRSRVTNRSSRHADSSIVLRRGIFQDDQSLETNKRAHTETVQFLKRYFDFQTPISVQSFIDRVAQDYGQLWDNQNVEQLMDHFSFKINQIFGNSVIPRQLIAFTKDNGIIGLILQIFQSINETAETTSHYSRAISFSKSPNVMSINKSFEEQLSECANIQHLKNIIQEFMELMYQEMQKELYSKFNAQMKRMVLKYRDTERMLKKIQEKLTMNADYFEAQQKWQRKIRVVEQNHLQTKRKMQKIEDQLKKERETVYQLKSIKGKLEDENSKLRQNLEKFQNILINKFQNLPNSENTMPTLPNLPSLSRKLPSNGSNGPLMDRTQEFSNQGSSYHSEPKPFQIKIDTHVIHRDMGPPITQTTTTFMDQNFNGGPSPSLFPMAESNIGPITYSPAKINNSPFDSGRPSYQGRLRPGTKIGDFTYAPYTGKHSRIH